MLMVNCNKCGKPIDHTHNFRLVPADLTTVAEHINCNDPIEAIERVLKELPDFTWESKGKNKTV